MYVDVELVVAYVPTNGVEVVKGVVHIPNPHVFIPVCVGANNGVYVVSGDVSPPFLHIINITAITGGSAGVTVGEFVTSII